MRCAPSASTIGGASGMFGWYGCWSCCSSQSERRHSKKMGQLRYDSHHLVPRKSTSQRAAVIGHSTRTVGHEVHDQLHHHPVASAREWCSLPRNGGAGEVTADEKRRVSTSSERTMIRDILTKEHHVGKNTGQDKSMSQEQFVFLSIILPCIQPWMRRLSDVPKDVLDIGGPTNQFRASSSDS